MSDSTAHPSDERLRPISATRQAARDIRSMIEQGYVPSEKGFEALLDRYTDHPDLVGTMIDIIEIIDSQGLREKFNQTTRITESGRVIGMYDYMVELVHPLVYIEPRPGDDA